ncbi:MAG: GPI anchored serine-threonine rich family protein [Candidatus Hydrogenedentes bacterium]|nr:GPI anchored serine-threonine rich family protein [Candidatus Hydrogenedentota bacterium]
MLNTHLRKVIAIMAICTVCLGRAFAENGELGTVVYGPLSGHPDAVTSDKAAKGNTGPYTITTSATAPLLPENASGYTPNGYFVVNIADNSECGSTFDLKVVGAPFSAVTGPSRVQPTEYVNRPAGNGFLFENANPGQYIVEVTPHDPCNPEQGYYSVELVVPDGDAPAITLSVTIVRPSAPGADDGSFTINVANAEGCTGTYTVNNPANNTTVTTYIGFPQGNFFFAAAGAGIYTIGVTETSGCATLQTDPTYISFEVPDGVLGSLALLTPNGDEKWKAGSKKAITWDQDGETGVAVKVDLYRNGAFVETIKSNTPNDGLFKWTIPSGLTAGGGYVVRVASTADPTIKDYSDGSFRIKPAKKRGKLTLK